MNKKLLGMLLCLMSLFSVSLMAQDAKTVAEKVSPVSISLTEEGAEMGAPKYMEWYATFGLLVTLIWLYIEILRLLSKLNSRR